MCCSVSISISAWLTIWRLQHQRVESSEQASLWFRIEVLYIICFSRYLIKGHFLWALILKDADIFANFRSHQLLKTSNSRVNGVEMFVYYIYIVWISSVAHSLWVCMYISFLWFCVELVELGSGYNLWLALHPLPLLFFLFVVFPLHPDSSQMFPVCISPPSLVLLFFF